LVPQFLATASPANLLASDSAQAVSIISKFSRTELEHFTIYTPEYVQGKYIEYLQLLDKIIVSYKDVGVRLIDPLNIWALKMATQPNYADEIWLLPTYDDSVEENLKQLQGFFNQSGGSDEALAERKFYDIYKDSTGIKTIEKLIDGTVTAAGKIISLKLSEKAEELSNNFRKLADAERKNENHLSSLSQAKSQMISTLVYQGAKELELLALVIHLIKVAAYAHTESLKRIKTLGR
jgi:hypothetical protein